MLTHRKRDYRNSQNEFIRPLSTLVWGYLVKNTSTTNWRKKIKKYQLSPDQLEYIINTVEYLLMPEDIYNLITNKSVDMEWLNNHHTFITQDIWEQIIPVFADYDFEFLMKNKERMDPWTVVICKTFTNDAELCEYTEAIIDSRINDKYVVKRLFEGLLHWYPITIEFIDKFKEYIEGKSHPRSIKRKYQEYIALIHNPHISSDIINHYAIEIKQSVEWGVPQNVRPPLYINNTTRMPQPNPHAILSLLKHHNINNLLDNYYDVFSLYFEIVLMYQQIDIKYVERYINEFNLQAQHHQAQHHQAQHHQQQTKAQILEIGRYFKPAGEIDSLISNINNISLSALMTNVSMSLNLSPGLYLLDRNYRDYFINTPNISPTRPLFWYVFSFEYLQSNKNHHQCEMLISKYKNNVNWGIIAETQPMTEQFIEQHLEYIDLNILMMNQYVMLSKEFLYKHREKINNFHLEWYLKSKNYFKWIMFQRHIIEYIWRPPPAQQEYQEYQEYQEQQAPQPAQKQTLIYNLIQHYNKHICIAYHSTA
jgi:hypothetical protein